MWIRARAGLTSDMKRKSIERYMIHRKRNERNIMQPGCNAAITRRCPRIYGRAPPKPLQSLMRERGFIYLLSLSPSLSALFFFFFPSLPRLRVPEKIVRATHIPNAAGRGLALRCVMFTSLRRDLVARIEIAHSLTPHRPGTDAYESIRRGACLQTRARRRASAGPDRASESRKNSLSSGVES